MKYYEIWFYYYGEDNEKTDFEKEFTFYCKVDYEIRTRNEMIEHLIETFPMTEMYNMDEINCIDEKHFDNLSDFFEISPQEFESSCGISA